MRKFTFVVCLLLTFINSRAQLSFEATSDYGKLWNMIYDNTVANKLYALSLSNHVMVSTDNGISWKIMYSFPSGVVHLSVLKMVPGGKTLSFVVSGNPDGLANGLYLLNIKTSTIKTHFTPPNWDDNPAIVSYSIYDEAATKLLMHTSYSKDFAPFTKVFYTMNTGTDWKEVYFSADNSDVQVNNVAISPKDSTKLFIARSLGSQDINGGLFVSVDSGNTWTEKLPGMALDPIAFNPINPEEIFIGTGISFGATPERLYHSINGANSFDSVAITWHDQTLNNITVLQYDPVDQNIVWLLEDNEFGKSTDGGKTWSMKNFTPDNTIYTYGTSITVNPLNNQQLFITSDGYPQFSNNGGATIMQAKSPFCVINSVAYGNYAASQDIFYASQYGYFHKNLTADTTKGYQTRSPFIVNLRSYTLFTDSMVNGRLFTYLPGDGFSNAAKFSFSDNRGATLTALPTEDFSTGLEFVERDPSAVSQYYVSYSFYASSSTLFKLNFSDPANPVATPVALPGATVATAMAVSPVKPGVLFLAQGVKVYKSVNAGLNWIDQSTGLEGLSEGTDMIWSIKCNPLNPNQFIIATSQGLFMSDDSTENWHLALSDFNTKKAAFSPLVNGHIIAGRYTALQADGALLYSTNGGSGWKTVYPDALQYLSVSGMDFKFSPNSISTYFATPDLGVVKYELSNLAGPLPVHLLSFAAALKNNNAQLLWKTSHEENVKRYELERSTDGFYFEQIGAKPAINGSGDHTYNYEDAGFRMAVARTGTVYYRLKMIDNDGSFSYSPVAVLTGTPTTRLQVVIYSNPVNATVNLQLKTIKEGEYVLKLLDAAGKEYMRRNYRLGIGNSAISLPAANLAPGMYTLVLTGIGGEMKYVKILKN